MKWGGPLFLASGVILVTMGGMVSIDGIKKKAEVLNYLNDDISTHVNIVGATGYGRGDFTNNVPGTNGVYNDPSTGLPENPPQPGDIPPGGIANQTGMASVDFDGIGQYPANDTHIGDTSLHTADGQPLNGDVTKYVVYNPIDNPGVKPGDRAYVYNYNTGQGTWAIVGDAGPRQSKAEVSAATFQAVGGQIDRNADGSYRNSGSDHKLSITYYKN
jgi:hypothetical protein